MANTSVIVIPEGKICDYVDGKFRNDTPEEYVRQTIEKRLVNEHKYLPKQIRIEYTLQLGSRKPRADIVIFDKDCGEQTQENIKIIIECKKEAVEARNAKDGVEQLKSYMSACPNCEWGMWTNGRQKEVYHKYVNDKGQIDFMDYNDIPSADGNLDDINRPKRTTLKECIEYIASQPNRFKTYTMNLINAEDADGSAYRENIAKLHGSLLNAAIVTQEYIGVRQSVSFAEVAVKNANTLKQKDYYQHHYECSRAHGKMKTVVTIKATGDSVFCFEQDGYDIDVLRQQSGFIGLTQRQKEQCEECYRELTPYHITSVLASGEATKQMGAYNFINDAGKISEAIVIILYMLRCCLAHGDISPDESANEVYKYAYEVLCAPLRKLK